MNIGELRRSQAITTFGPGAVIDLKESSVMAASIDDWPSHAVEIHEPELENALRVKAFKMPAISQSESAADFPVVRFPNWLVCPKCKRLAPDELFAGLFRGNEQLRCRECNLPPHPARLVIACPAGHIDDFPWDWWVHHGSNTICERPALYLNSMSRTAAISDLVVWCKNCNRRKSLGNAFGKTVFKDRPCSGRRPWLHDTEECSRTPVTLQRGASNVYYSVMVSGLSIPPWSSAVQSALDRDWRTLSSARESRLADAIIDLGLVNELKIDVDKIVQAVLARKRKLKGEEVHITSHQLRQQEYQALSSGTPSEEESERSQFSVSDEEVNSAFEEVIQSVRRVDRLREVRVLRGFTRVEPPGNQSTFDRVLCPLSKASPLPEWLPGIEVRGEGIFLELDIQRLLDWEKQPLVINRIKKLNDLYIAMYRERNWEIDKEVSPRFVLVHTLAHLLIRQFSLVCGYSSSALRERLYVTEASPDGNHGTAAVLIYTATPDSEGSLGGLVRQSQPARLGAMLAGALEEALWCSSDPLCIESSGQGYGGLNMAACHACALLPETCCEEFNRLLDRALIIGMSGYSEIGFFSSVIENLIAMRSF